MDDLELLDDCEGGTILITRDYVLETTNQLHKRADLRHYMI